MAEPVLKAENVTKYFDIGGGLFKKADKVHAVENVSFSLYDGETLGIVGESGSGKSTLARVILGLVPITSGKVFYNGNDITGIKGPNAKYLRQELQMVFQDPYASLNPRLKIGNAIMEPMLVNKVVQTKEDAKKRTLELLELVGLHAQAADRFPHEFSGGQRQRVGIARALAMNPKILICDESVSALDVSVQAQILNLFNKLKKQLKLTYMFIGHDLSVVKYISDRILVMYLGEVIEMAETEELFSHTLHPYTKALISAIPLPTTEKQDDRILLEGDIPSTVNPPSGCRFCMRCFMAKEKCRHEHPKLEEIRPGHFVSCHYWNELEGGAEID
ncbi:ABC transporter ATP-binding protein [Anaerotignum faecicola]